LGDVNGKDVVIVDDIIDTGRKGGREAGRQGGRGS